MTKYREILRLKSLNLSQQNIAHSCNVSKKTVNRVLKRAEELGLPGRLMKMTQMLSLQKSFSLLQSKTHPLSGCQTIITSVKSYSVMESLKSSCGQSTWRTAVLMAMNRSCIHSSAITFSRMSRNGVQPCISTANPVNRWKLTGQVIQQQSSIPIPRDHQNIYICWRDDI